VWGLASGGPGAVKMVPADGPSHRAKGSGATPSRWFVSSVLHTSCSWAAGAMSPAVISAQICNRPLQSDERPGACCDLRNMNVLAPIGRSASAPGLPTPSSSPDLPQTPAVATSLPPSHYPRAKGY
jgi:hypothetical protein